MTILFDLDDTLLDHRHACDRGARTLHQRAGVRSSADDFVARWEASLQRRFDRYLAGELSYEQQRLERVREALDAGVSDPEAAQWFGIYLEAYEASWALFPDVLPALEQLSDRRVGIITNGQGGQQRRKLAQTGLLERCACVVISEEVGSAKPEAAIFRHACERLGIAPDAAVFVGDRYDVDAQAARRAGLRGVWLDRQHEATPAHEAPILQSLSGLPDLVAQITASRG